MIYFLEDWQQWMATLGSAGEDRMPWLIFTDWMEEHVTADSDRVLWEFIRFANQTEKLNADDFVRKYTSPSSRKALIEYTRELYPLRPGGEFGNMSSLVARNDGTPVLHSDVEGPPWPFSGSMPFDVKLRWKRGLPFSAEIRVNAFMRDGILPIGHSYGSDWPRALGAIYGSPGNDFAYDVDGNLQVTPSFAEMLLKLPALLATIMHIHLRTPINVVKLSFVRNPDLDGQWVEGNEEYAHALTLPFTFDLKLDMREKFAASGIFAEWRRLHDDTRSQAGKLMYPSLRYSTAGLELLSEIEPELITWLQSCGLAWPRLPAISSHSIADLLRVAQRTPYSGIISLPQRTPAQPAEIPPQSSPTR